MICSNSILLLMYHTSLTNLIVGTVSTLYLDSSVKSMGNRKMGEVNGKANWMRCHSKSRQKDKFVSYKSYKCVIVTTEDEQYDRWLINGMSIANRIEKLKPKLLTLAFHFLKSKTKQPQRAQETNENAGSLNVLHFKWKKKKKVRLIYTLANLS